MKKDTIEVSFTEEEKKNWTSEKNLGKKIVSQPQSNFFFNNYTGEQKIIFSVLMLLLIFITCFCKFYKETPIDPTDPSPVPQQRQSLFLSKGEEAPIVDANNNGLKHILVGVGWDPATGYGNNMDVDSSVILFDTESKKDYTVYFSQKKGPNNCVKHHGDNLTGEDYSHPLANSSNADDENIDVYLDDVPLKYDKIYFILNIFEAYNRNQTLNIVQNMYINIYDPASNTLLMTYQVSGETQGTGLILGVATRDETTYENQLPTQGQSATSRWSFKAIGQTYNVEDINDLRDIIRD